MPDAVPMKLRMSFRLDGGAEVQPDRLARAGVQQRRRVQRARVAPQLIDPRLRARRLDALANLPLELGGLRLRDPVGAHDVERLLVLGQRLVELVLLLEVPRPFEVHAGRFFLGAAQVHLVFAVVRIRLDGLGEIAHRRVPVGAVHRVLPLAERARGRAPGGQHREQKKSRQFTCHMSAISSQLSAFSPIVRRASGWSGGRGRPDIPSRRTRRRCERPGTAPAPVRPRTRTSAGRGRRKRSPLVSSPAPASR